MGIPIRDKPETIVVPVEDPRDPRNTRLVARIHLPSASIQIPGYNDTTYVCPHYAHVVGPPSYIKKENFQKSIREVLEVNIRPEDDKVILSVQEGHFAVTEIVFHSDEYARFWRLMA